MSAHSPSTPRSPLHNWLAALAAVIASLAAMAVMATLGLWAAGAADLPDGAFAPVLAAVLVLAVGGTVRLSGDAGGLAGTEGGLTVIPLSVTLTGALLLGWCFLRPLHRRTVAGTPGLAAWTAQIAVVWILAVLGLALAARRTFEVSLGEDLLGDLGELFGVTPTVGFAAEVLPTVLIGLVWLAGVLLVALLVSHGAPLPPELMRFQAGARPAARATLGLLLVAVAVALGVALAVAATRGHAAETFAVILLGLPNVAWLALTVGLGATWEGRVEGPFGLPMPRVLDEVLRTPDVSELNLGSLAEHDGARWWWLLVIAAVLVLATACSMAATSPARVPPWQHALRLAVALALAVLTVGPTARVSARIGLSVLGIGDLGEGLTGQVLLEPRLWGALGLALLWGLAAGFAGAWAVRVLRRRRQ
ncbi:MULTISPECIES: streptophobe family protein [Streptomyces]|uniref:Integral membrane protein n=1 Tax=Streptomyces pseudogriseolus TaxID=36817 RepID=A0ABQ2SYK3_STREZ|nr:MULTISPECIES: streptophobe family protein [Streptomyces]GGQ14652.1 hypothetical protein GCM10010233_34660 [Streptomyces gancidicus]GGS44678.1 hypothetical protein GCM10010285_25280 [Streptomyces rubiginosus]